jgi:hypothetical protein
MDPKLLAAVKSALAKVPADGRFGADRVFVSSLYRELARNDADFDHSLDSFKDELLKGNRAGELVLARADLVGAMDPARVRASEISYLNSTFHFVLDRSAQ